jgi:hypothetical protein
LTAQGHPRSIFQRAIEHGNLLAAETTARELGRITLAESLALTALAVQKAPERRSRYTVRWLRRLLEEAESLTIEEAAQAAATLVALGGRSHEQALATLSAMAERATRQTPRRWVAS